MKANAIKPNIVIIGASGHAKVIIDIIEKNNDYTIVGLIDSYKPTDYKLYDYKVLGKEKDIKKLKKIYNFNTGIIAIGDNWTRKQMHEKIIKSNPDFNFGKALHHKAVIGKNVSIGQGTVIMAGVIVNSDAKINDFCILNTKASLGHDAKMLNYSSLAPNSTIGGGVTIGICTAICLSSTVIQDLIIGHYCVVGTGSIVLKSIPDLCLYYGAPARFVRTIAKGEKYLSSPKKHSTKLTSNTKTNTPTLKLITEEDQWNKILKKIGYYDFYHTYGYHHLSKNQDETPILITYKNNDILIALPLILRDIPETPYKDATSAYGYAGPISKGVNLDFDNNLFIKKLKQFLFNKNVIAVFSRLNPFIPHQSLILKDFGKINTQGKVVNINLTLNLDEQRAIYRSRLKTHVNKARRLCNVQKGKSPEDLDAFINIYYENMKRVNAKPFYFFNREYFKVLMASNEFKTELLLATKKDTNEIIAGCLFITTNNIVQYHLSGTKCSYLQLNPTKLLIDQMRLMATKNELKYFNLGGGLGGRNDDSLFDFKSSFSKDFKNFNLWNLIVNPKIYNALAKQVAETASTDYFPIYRFYEDNKNLYSNG